MGKSSGGIAIYVRKNIKVGIIKNIINISDNLEVLRIKIKLDNLKNLCLLGIYRKPYGIEKTSTWIKLINSVNQHLNQNDLIFLMGDFNAHHRL